MKISKIDFERYSKQIILKKFGVIGQKKTMSTKVLIFGVGGLGCPLSIYLANLGIGNIGIVDDDKVELSNLNRQIIFSQNFTFSRYRIREYMVERGYPIGLHNQHFINIYFVKISHLTSVD